MYVYTQTYIFPNTYTYTYTNVYIYTHIYVYQTRPWFDIYIYVYVNLYICICICIYIYIYIFLTDIYVYVYIYKYTYIYTCICMSSMLQMFSNLMCWRGILQMPVHHILNVHMKMHMQHVACHIWKGPYIYLRICIFISFRIDAHTHVYLHHTCVCARVCVHVCVYGWVGVSFHVCLSMSIEFHHLSLTWCVCWCRKGPCVTPREQAC